MKSVAIGRKVDCSTAGPHTNVYHLAHAKTCQTFPPHFPHTQPATSLHSSLRRQRHGNEWIAESFVGHSDDGRGGDAWEFLGRASVNRGRKVQQVAVEK